MAIIKPDNSAGMRAPDVVQSLKWLALARKPCIIIGPPGVGKTSVAEQVMRSLNWELITTRIAELQTVDGRGMPITDLKAKSTRWLSPAEFPREGCAPTGWFLDEYPQGKADVQAVFGRLLNERRLGEYRVPDNVYIFAAGNAAKHRAATNKMPGHIADRFFWLYMEPDLKAWCSWAFGAGIETELIAFLRWQGAEALSNYDPSKDVSPTCRSWEDISVAMAAKRTNKLDIPLFIEEQTYAGKVGQGMASELMAFLEVFRSMPDPLAMLANPDKCELPGDSKPAVLCAICAGLSRRATDNNMDAVVKIANRLPEEFSTLLILQAVGRDKELMSTRAFCSWAELHQEALS